jgi:hypothetical protein
MSPPPPRGRQGLEPWGTWQHRSPPEQGGEVRSLVTHGTTGALPSREARSGALRHVVAPEPCQVGGEVRNHGARGNAGSRFDREAGSRAIGQVAAPEPSRAGRRSPKLCDTWQHQSPPEQGGGVWSRVTRGSIGALLSREAGSGAAGHVAVRGCTFFSLSWLEACMRGTDSLVHCHCCGKPHTFLALWPTCHTHNFVTSFATLVAKDLLATLWTNVIYGKLRHEPNRTGPHERMCDNCTNTILVVIHLKGIFHCSFATYLPSSLCS